MGAWFIGAVVNVVSDMPGRHTKRSTLLLLEDCCWIELPQRSTLRRKCGLLAFMLFCAGREHPDQLGHGILP